MRKRKSEGEERMKEGEMESEIGAASVSHVHLLVALQCSLSALPLAFLGIYKSNTAGTPLSCVFCQTSV